MQETCYVYQPFKNEARFIHFAEFLKSASMFFAGFFLAKQQLTSFLFLLLPYLVGCWCGIKFSNAANSMVMIDSAGIRLIEGRKRQYTCISWENLNYSCYGKNRRNFQYLILSQAPISKETAAKLANKSSETSRLYLEGCVVLYLDSFQNVQPMTDFVKSKLSFIS